MSILDAAKQGDLPAVQRIVQSNPQAVREGEPGEQALHYAAWLDHPLIARYLLEHGADVNCTDAEKRTPLHYAALHNHPELVHVLLEFHPECSATDQYGFTAAVYAIRERTPEGEEILNLLLHAGAEYGLHEAVARGDAGRVRQILEKNINAVSIAPNHEQLLVDALIGGAMYDGKNLARILELLFQHGLRVPKSVLLSEASQCDELIGALLRHAASNIPED